MSRTLFLEGWKLQRGSSSATEDVRLPHDAMIGEPRSAEAETGNHCGYFPGGEYRYSRKWLVPEDAENTEYRLFFEGVYGNTRIVVDGAEVASCNSGYRSFYAPLSGAKPNTTVEIDVCVDNTRTPNARWYTGSGIYRPVWLDSRGPVHIADDGIHLVTKSLGKEAEIEIAVRVDGISDGCTALICFKCEGEQVASVELPVTKGVARGVLNIPQARPWSAETPFLYDVSVVLKKSGEVVDEEHLRTGLRTVHVDAENGLRINGEKVLLRGACLHSDNGLLGAVTLPAAEYRRARILKEAGYNAIRASHNPFQSGFLDACDELGLYVIDELTDVWFKHKTRYDNADVFGDVWPADARAMIAEDRNRPSVIMYSIGNEISETATVEGVEVARSINDFIKQLDPTRPTTLAVNLLLNLMASRGVTPFSHEDYAGEKSQKSEKKNKKEVTSTAANMVTAKLGMIVGFLSRLPAADKNSKEAFAQVDVAGYNYAYGRYKGDRKRHPQRVIVGSESMPGDLPKIWKRVLSVPGVIGDFMWTGWDYLGESGLGTWSYGKEHGGIIKPYPALLAGCGAIDITGLRGAPILLARAVWGLSKDPGIAVRPLIYQGMRTNKAAWRSTDAIESWAWRGATGKAEVEVYSPDEEVELLINGRSVGKKRSGAKANFISHFKLPYEEGELVAVSYSGGREVGRSSLRSAGPARLKIEAERPGINGPDDLAYLSIQIADEHGVVESTAIDQVSIRIEGAADLAGFGSASPISEDSFVSRQCHTCMGRAQAILRGGAESGKIIVTVNSQKYGEAVLELDNKGA